MTDLLDRAVTAARNLPPEAQDEIARVVLKMATDEEPVYVLTPRKKPRSRNRGSNRSVANT